jgi:hypothetical protein
MARKRQDSRIAQRFPSRCRIFALLLQLRNHAVPKPFSPHINP